VPHFNNISIFNNCIADRDGETWKAITVFGLSYVNNTGPEGATFLAGWEDLHVNEIEVFEIPGEAAFPSKVTRLMSFECHPRD
jgi:hypothetical protein